MKKIDNVMATLKGRAKMDKKYNKDADAVSYNYQYGILMSQNEFKTILEYHESLYGQILLLKAQVEALKNKA